MSNKYKKSVINLVKASEDLDFLGYSNLSNKVLKLAHTLYTTAQANDISSISEKIKNVSGILIEVYSLLAGLDQENRLPTKFITPEVANFRGKVYSTMKENVNSVEEAKSRSYDLQGFISVLVPQVEKLQTYKGNPNIESNQDSICQFRIDQARQIYFGEIFPKFHEGDTSSLDAINKTKSQIKTPEKSPQNFTNYVKNLQSGVSYLLSAISKAKGTQRDTLLAQLNKEVQELNRVYRQVTPSNKKATPDMVSVQDQITAILSSISKAQLPVEDIKKMPDFEHRIAIFD